MIPVFAVVCLSCHERNVVTREAPNKTHPLLATWLSRASSVDWTSVAGVVT